MAGQRIGLRLRRVDLSLLIKNDWSDQSVNWLEEHLQMAIVQYCKRHKYYRNRFVVVGDMNAEGRTQSRGAKLKATGMQAGEPDLRFYFLGGSVVFVELKRKSGKLNSAQVLWHDQLAHLGFLVTVIYATTPQNAVDQVKAILDEIFEN